MKMFTFSLTDIDKHKSDGPYLVISHWLRNRNAIEYPGIWETLFNPEFKPIEFDRFKKEAGLGADNIPTFRDCGKCGMVVPLHLKIRNKPL